MNLIGKELDGRYEILEEIGKGGMAHVYKSRDKQLNRLVAVKVLKEDLRDDKEFVRRFNVEAQAAASLSNPHIVSIYDVGCADGLHYIVMEFIKGETLKNYIERVGVINWREAANYSIQICEGIEEAHKNKVIHRDIKPQNIIMAPDGVLKITDFGIARATTQATMTMASNNTIGTAHYLSPEQARGGYTDERTDIYSMGVVMYEMLTGTLPFDDSSPVAIAIKHLQENAAPVTALNPDVPKAFEYIVMKAMSKEQDRRYSTVTDMIRDLKNMLDDPSIEIGKSNSIQGGRRRRSLDPFDDSDSTLKMPAIDDSEDFGMDIPGYDIDDIDEQDMQYEEMERLNERRAKRMKKKQERKIAFIAFLSALAVLAAGFAVTYALTDGFGIFGTQKDMMTIPNVVGMTLKDAQRQYGKDFSIIEKSKEKSTKPAGTILEQTPAAGQNMRKSDSVIISVVVSSGENSVVLSNYIGQSIEDVKKELNALGLNYKIEEKVSADVESGKVIEQYPKAGSSVESDDMISLVVSKGPESSAKPTATAENDKTNENKPTTAPSPKETAKSEPNTDTNEGNTGGTGSGNTGNNGGSTGGSGGGNTGGAGGGDTDGSTGGSNGGNETSGGGSDADELED